MAVSRAVVVGAGLAGLAAAQELARRGWTVEIFERSRQLGGKATSFAVEGAVVDNGQHVHLACCTEYVDFVRRAGMADRLQLQERFSVLVLHRGRRPARLHAAPLPAPLHLLASFARYGALGVAGRARVAWALAAARRPAGDAETAAGWLRRHGQTPATFAAFWEPFFVPALNAPLAEASAQALLFTLRTVFLSDAGGARIGWATVPLAEVAEAAVRDVSTVHRQTAVTGLAGDPGRVVGVQVEGGRIVRCDAVVLAVPPDRLRRLLRDPERFGLDGLADLCTEPIVDVHLWYDAPIAGLEFAAVLESPLQWVFQKAPGYLACSLSAARQAVTRPEAELVAMCAGELAGVLPELRARRLLRGAATRDPHATVIPAPGLGRPAPGLIAPGLALAGAWTATGWPDTMESAVRSGRAAARALTAAASEERAVA
ncbi:MAG TPA: hydroxysqualene dehydroxylase HpnE [Candidatus Dormibacteraeota bacterium]